MKWLLWKDYRANRMIVGMAIFLLVVPHVFVILGVLATKRGSPANSDIPNLAVGLIVSAAYSLGLLQLVLAFLGGNVIAGERFDRSAEFLASLPVSRRRILASKLLLTLGLLAMIWLPNLLILALALPGMGLGTGGTLASEALVPLRIMPFIGLAVFGVAWLASALGRSPALAACLGMLAPGAVGLALWGLVWALRGLVLLAVPSGVFASAAGGIGPALERNAPVLAEACYDGLCLIVAVVCFVVGTRKYLRGVEP